MATVGLRRVVVAGGTGLVGRPLVKALTERGTQVIVLSRNPERLELPSGATAQRWERLANLLDGTDAVINLAGEGIADRRWSAARKAAIRDSRFDATSKLVAAMRACAHPPKALVNASAIGYYIPKGEIPVDESTAPGAGFLAEVCQAWEAEAMAASALGIRVSIVRIGVVLAREGGALPKMALPVRLFQGCKLGHGQQGLSWIHVDDLVRLILEAASNPAYQGAVNATSPGPVTNESFTRALARRLHRPMLPIPAWVTRTALGALFGAMGREMLLEGAFVYPRKAQELGFAFRFERVEDALDDLLMA